MDHVRTVLKVNGAIPRRAVLLPDGGLGDRVHHPDVPEAELVSRLCEIARGPARSYSRRTADLLEQALTDNSPGAWQCVRDDLVTRDLDLDIAATVLRQSANAAALVACLVGARDNKHLVHVSCLLSQVLDRVCEETRTELGRAIACQLRPVMDVFVVHGAAMPRHVIESVLSGFGRTLAHAGIPDARVADGVMHALGAKRDDLLRLFLNVSPTFVDHREHQIVPALLARSKACTPQTRYPVIAMLARVMAHNPGMAAGCEPAIADLVRAALGTVPLDSRECLAAATLVSATQAATDVAGALARALQHTSSAIIQKAA